MRIESELEKIIKRIHQLPNGEEILAQTCAHYPSLEDKISHEIITDPVEVGTGIIYDRSNIEEWKKTSINCPITRNPMTNIVPNASFRELMISILQPILARAQQQQKERMKQRQQRQRQKMQTEDRPLMLRRQFEQLVRSTTGNQDHIRRQLTNFEKMSGEKRQVTLNRLRNLSKKP